jgi:hypothetical protein
MRQLLVACPTKASLAKVAKFTVGAAQEAKVPGRDVV